MPYPAQRLSGISRDVAASASRTSGRPSCSRGLHFSRPATHFPVSYFKQLFASSCQLHPRFPVGRLPYPFTTRESSIDYKNLFSA